MHKVGFHQTRIRFMCLLLHPSFNDVGQNQLLNWKHKCLKIIYLYAGLSEKFHLKFKERRLLLTSILHDDEHPLSIS